MIPRQTTPVSAGRQSTRYRWNKNPVRCNHCPTVSTSQHALYQHHLTKHRGLDKGPHNLEKAEKVREKLVLRLVLSFCAFYS